MRDKRSTKFACSTAHMSWMRRERFDGARSVAVAVPSASDPSAAETALDDATTSAVMVAAPAQPPAAAFPFEKDRQTAARRTDPRTIAFHMSHETPTRRKCSI